MRHARRDTMESIGRIGMPPAGGAGRNPMLSALIAQVFGVLLAGLMIVFLVPQLPRQPLALAALQGACAVADRSRTGASVARP